MRLAVQMGVWGRAADKGCRGRSLMRGVCQELCMGRCPEARTICDFCQRMPLEQWIIWSTGESWQPWVLVTDKFLPHAILDLRPEASRGPDGGL